MPLVERADLRRPVDLREDSLATFSSADWQLPTKWPCIRSRRHPSAPLRTSSDTESCEDKCLHRVSRVHCLKSYCNTTPQADAPSALIDALETNKHYNTDAQDAENLDSTAADVQERREPVQALTREQFRDALQKGLGRAVLHAREHGLAGLEDDLLHACLHTQHFGVQSSGERAAYLYFLIDLATDKDVFRVPILQALADAPANTSGESEGKTFWNLEQLFDLAVIFAERGDVEARRRMYERFDREISQGRWLGEEQIVQLDGIKGLVHMAGVIGETGKNRLRLVDEALRMRHLIEYHGKETVLSALAHAARTNPGVKTFLATAEPEWFEFKRSDTEPHVTHLVFPLESILAAVEAAAPEYGGQYSVFGRRASQDEIEFVFGRLLQEARPEQLVRYLCIFGHRAMPRLEQRILDLAVTPSAVMRLHPDTLEAPWLQWRAIRALANLSDPAIRDLGIRLLRKQPHMVRWGTIELFNRNYQQGDISLIMAALPTKDVDAVHSASLDLVVLAKAQNSPELAEAMMWVYEHAPSANCRYRAFAALTCWNQAPAWMTAEARWDCNAQTRHLATQGCEHRG